jgi:PAS domain S-box-containing protein
MTARHTDGLGALLRLHKGRIVDRWCQRVLDDPMVPEASRLPLPALRDHIPALLERLTETLEERSELELGSERAGRRIGTAAESRAHARERFFEGYKLPGALRELSHLRSAIGDMCKAEGAAVTMDELLLLNAALDEAMAAAAEAIHQAARHAAEQSEFKFRRLADSGVLGIIITSGSGAILEANAEFLRMVGHSAEDLRAGRLRWLDMTPPEFHALDEHALLELRESGTTKTYEKEYVHKDGSRVMVTLGIATLSPVDDTYIAYVLDVTARKRAEQALREVARERDETLDLLDTFLASAPVGFAVIDREFRYLRINQTLAAMNGRSIAEHLGRPIREVVPDVASLEELLRRVLDSGEPVLGLEQEVIAPASGQELHVLVSFHPLHDPAGRIYAVGAIVVDITEQARALVEIQRHAAFRERLMAILGHDLRQPLSLIALTAETWLKQEDLPEGLLRSAQRVARTAARMGRMIADILDLARVRQGSGIPITPRPIDLESICRTVLDEISMTRPSRQIELLSRDRCAGTWDPDRLAQVVSNLVTNALDYSPPDTPVLVEIAPAGDRVRMQVRNQGRPIAPELLPTLFDPFRRGQAESRSASQGLGLGLYIAREVVRAHGGDISVISSLSTGTVFTVELPARCETSGAGL